MSILDKLKVWASSGDTTEPTDGYIADGWQTLQRPSRQKWNWLENKRDTMINAVIDAIESCRTTPGHVDYETLCEGFSSPSDRWHDPAAYPNVLSSGLVINDACLGYDLTLNQPFLWVIHSDVSIAKMSGPWEYDSAPAMNSPVSPSFPSTPDRLLALCCDALYLYVAWCETDGDIQVTKFNASTLAEVWTCDTGMTSSSMEDITRLIVADTSNLAILLPGNADDGLITGYGTGIIAKSDGGISIGVAVESSVNTSFLEKSQDIISDGTYVYFVMLDITSAPTLEFDLIKMEIADPTTSTITAIDSVTDTEWEDQPCGLIASAEDSILVFYPNGEVKLVHEDTVYYMHDANVGTLEAVGATGYGVPVGFDGVNVWALYDVNGDDGGCYRLYGKSLQLCHRQLADDSAYPTPIIGTATEPINRFKVVPFDGYEMTEQTWPGKMIYDGRDMWIVLAGGDIYRLTAPGMR